MTGACQKLLGGHKKGLNRVAIMTKYRSNCGVMQHNRDSGFGTHSIRC
jgi:hypothetical protein